jgi:hypothetical protein
MLKNYTIENCLEMLAGFTQESDKFSLLKEDHTIMHSIAKQTFRGTALTDRQFALMQTKLLQYTDQFKNADIVLEDCINNLRQPLRSINREKYIRLEDGRIKLRFPFKKSDIMLINEISSHDDWNGTGYSHQKGSHEHFFGYNETNVLNLLDRFINRSFIIDDELLEIYHEIKHMVQLKDKFIPGIYNMELKNINRTAISLLKNDIGELNKSTLIKYVDRRFKYGIEYIDDYAPSTGCENIAYRKDTIFESKPSEQTLNHLLDDLWQLDRFPILVVLDKDHAETQLHSMLTYYRDILNVEQQCVLFRLEDKAAGFNQLIKDRKLNNWVDKTTKVVYISKDKLPKVLVNNEWNPTVTLTFNSTMDKNVNTFINSKCDLVIFREEYVSPFRRHSRIYG